MKKILLLAALLCLTYRPAHAQAAPPVETVAPVSAPQASLSNIPGTAEQLTADDWIKLGKNFGSRGQWQFGFDKSATLGSCAAYAVRARFLMAGPCRDVLLLAKDKRPVFHLGGAALYSASHQPGYFVRTGITVGPAAKGVLEYGADKLPYIESVNDWKAPPALAYIGKIATFDYSAGIVNGRFDHGPQVKVDVPLADLRALLGL